MSKRNGAAGGNSGNPDETARQDAKIMLIDGHSLAHRAFFALPPLKNTAGQQTNAIYGFVMMLLKALEEEEPDYVAVAFDKKGKTFRHATYEHYKAHRPSAPDELVSQLALLREVLDALGVPVYELDGYEADDVLGTLTEKAAEAGCRAIIVTGDRDALQLVGPRVKVLLTRKGITEITSMGEPEVVKTYGLHPVQLVDVKGLMGDPSDNIPGVPGIGEKTALELIRRFGSVEEVLEHLEEIGGKRSETLAQHADIARLSKDLARIRTNLDISLDWDAAKRRDPDRPRLRELFRLLEFKSLIERLGLEGGPEKETTAPETAVERTTRIITTKEELTSLVEALGASPGESLEAGTWLSGDNGSVELAVLPELTGQDPLKAGLAALALSARRASSTSCEDPLICILTEEIEPGFLRANTILEALGPLLKEGGVRKVGHDLKPFLCYLRSRGYDLTSFFDTALAAYLLDPGRTEYPLEDLARHYLGDEVPAREDVFGKGKTARTPREVERENLASYLGNLAGAALRLAAPLRAELEARRLQDLYEQTEIPLVGILADMQLAGILVDENTLEELKEEFADRIAGLTGEIHGLADEEFNINSTQQLGHILFEKMGLPKIKQTKTGFSTDAEVLETLASEHDSELARKVLEYRQLVKLQGTYVVGLKEQINKVTGRVHTNFNQMATATGRLSSTEPNLQNIPAREEMGRRLRRVFTAPPGHVLLAADYSQIELRVLAHMSGDERFIQAFLDGEDIHRRTAAEVFGVPPEEVTDTLRAHAKAVNFGIVYGISDFGLARNIGIPREEARRYIESYFRRYPGVKQFIDAVVRQAHADGFVRTMFNRIRYLPDIKSRVWHRRQAAERTAMNTPIQGTAADIIKMAMVAIAGELRQGTWRSRMLLQVHDELVFECPANEEGALRDLVVGKMQNTVRLKVPLVVDVKVGPNWYEMQRVPSGQGSSEKASTDKISTGGE